MSHLFIIIGTFALFVPALMSPGPDFIAVVRSSMTRGTKAGLLTTLGVSIGLGVRRQGFWNQLLPKLRDRFAHLVGLIMRRVVCDASVAFRASFV